LIESESLLRQHNQSFRASNVKLSVQIVNLNSTISSLKGELELVFKQFEKYKVNEKETETFYKAFHRLKEESENSQKLTDQLIEQFKIQNNGLEEGLQEFKRLLEEWKQDDGLIKRIKLMDELNQQFFQTKNQLQSVSTEIECKTQHLHHLDEQLKETSSELKKMVFLLEDERKKFSEEHGTLFTSAKSIQERLQKSIEQLEKGSKFQ